MRTKTSRRWVKRCTFRRADRDKAVRQEIVLTRKYHLILFLQTIDAALLSSIKKVDNLGRYLKSSWGLSKGDKVHELKF